MICAMYDEEILNKYFVSYNLSKLKDKKEEKRDHINQFARRRVDMKKSPSIAAWVLQQVLVFTSTFAVIDKNTNRISHNKNASYH